MVAFRIPPLRERREDVPLLTDHFLRQFVEKLDRPQVRSLDPALSLLVAHEWPDSVRELENTLEHAVALASVNTLQPDDLPPRLVHGVGRAVSSENASPDRGHLQQAVARAQEAVERRLASLPPRLLG